MNIFIAGLIVGIVIGVCGTRPVPPDDVFVDDDGYFTPDERYYDATYTNHSR